MDDVATFIAAVLGGGIVASFITSRHESREGLRSRQHERDEVLRTRRIEAASAFIASVHASLNELVAYEAAVSAWQRGATRSPQTVTPLMLATHPEGQAWLSRLSAVGIEAQRRRHEALVHEATLLLLFPPDSNVAPIAARAIASAAQWQAVVARATPTRDTPEALDRAAAKKHADAARVDLRRFEHAAAALIYPAAEPKRRRIRWPFA